MGSLEDFQGFGDRLQREIDAIDEHDDVDQPYVRKFVNRKDGRLKESSLAVYLQNVRMASQRCDRPLIEWDRDYFEACTFRWRHDLELSDSTVKNYQNAVIAFLDSIDVDAEWTDDVEVVKPGRSNVDPDDMLLAEDIRALCEGATNMRDIAFIEFLADTGARFSLAASLRVRDVDLDSDRPTFTPNPNAKGLKGAEIREYPLIDSRATLRTYLDRLHPRPDDQDVAFFHKLPGHGNTPFEGDGALSPTPLRRQLKQAAEKGGVDKPVNPHNFRHSAVTRMRREGYDRAEVEKRVCWVVDSNMWQIYEHIAAEEANDAMFERAGMIETEDGPDAKRQRCGNCLELVAPQHPRCPRCGEPVDPEVRRITEQAEDELVEGIALSENEIKRRVEQAALKLVRQNDTTIDAEEVD